MIQSEFAVRTFLGNDLRAEGLEAREQIPIDRNQCWVIALRKRSRGTQDVTHRLARKGKILLSPILLRLRLPQRQLDLFECHAGVAFCPLGVPRGALRVYHRLIRCLPQSLFLYPRCTFPLAGLALAFRRFLQCHRERGHSE